MKHVLLIAALLLPAPFAHAVGSGCQATAGPLALEKVRSNAVGSEITGCYNRSLETISQSSVSMTGSTAAVSNLGAIYVNRIGGRNTGSAGITISSATTVISSMTLTASGATQYSLQTSSGIKMVGGVFLFPDGTVAYSTRQFGSSTASGHNISTGTLSVGGTSYPTQANLTFDSSFFTITNDAAHAATFASLNASSSTLNRTIQRFTSGSGTYTPSSGVSQIIVHLQDGGCGGGGAANLNYAMGGGGGAGGHQDWLITSPASYSYSVSTGSNGGGVALQGSSATPTSFGTLTFTPCGGGFGATAANTAVRPGPGGQPLGTITGGVLISSSSGGDGYAGHTTGSGSDALGGEGGASFYGGGGRGGGGTTGDFTRSCSSGTAPGSGGGGGAPSVALSACSGARGEIVVEEFFPAIGPAGATGATGATGSGVETNTFVGTKTITSDSFGVGSGSTSFRVAQGSVTTSGSVTAPSFIGSGASLTGIAAPIGAATFAATDQSVNTSGNPCNTNGVALTGALASIPSTVFGGTLTVHYAINISPPNDQVPCYLCYFVNGTYRAALPSLSGLVSPSGVGYTSIPISGSAWSVNTSSGTQTVQLYGASGSGACLFNRAAGQLIIKQERGQ